MEGYDNGKWPRRGPLVSVFLFSFVFIDTNAYLLHIQLLFYILRDIETDGRLQLWERAQTTLICALVDNVECFFFSFIFFESNFLYCIYSL